MKVMRVQRNQEQSERTSISKSFGQVQLILVRNWALYFIIHVLLLRVLCGYFAHARGISFEDVAAASVRKYMENFAMKQV